MRSHRERLATRGTAAIRGRQLLEAASADIRRSGASAEQVVTAQMNALQAGDARAFKFASPANKAVTGPGGASRR